MEWLKKKSLKQSFFIINILFLCIGLLLATLSFLFCNTLRNNIEISPKYEILLDEQGELVSSPPNTTDIVTEKSDAYGKQILLLTIIQFLLPFFFGIGSLVLSDLVFYQLKLKKPLKILQNGMERIQHQDLDFTIEKCADDEIGLLCNSFEKMRIELLHNNRELWKQMEERKRLNAAFSHDLRNPVTVLKGSVRIAKQGINNKTASDVQIMENLNRMEDYTVRIERYIETMNNAQRFEHILLEKKNIVWSNLISELEKMVLFIGLEYEKQVHLEAIPTTRILSLDSSVLFQIVENLLSNALRFADHCVHIACEVSESILEIMITDDGNGFSSTIIKNGIQPFQKGNEDTDHFGMGLYICKLLCQKHGGDLKINNGAKGAIVSATLTIK